MVSLSRPITTLRRNDYISLRYLPSQSNDTIILSWMWDDAEIWQPVEVSQVQQGFCGYLVSRGKHQSSTFLDQNQSRQANFTVINAEYIFVHMSK